MRFNCSSYRPQRPTALLSPPTVLTERYIADTRDNLLGFEDSLENRAQVLAVDLPIGTLASQENTAFDMTVTMQSL